MVNGIEPPLSAVEEALDACVLRSTGDGSDQSERSLKGRERDDRSVEGPGYRYQVGICDHGDGGCVTERGLYSALGEHVGRK